MKSRAILHVDMDAFYASVEERDHPELRGKPLIVGGIDGRGVVAAANYVVRGFGVRSAMPIGEAMRRCPQAICVRPRMALYQKVSAEIFEIFHEATPLVEGLSLDEAFLDVSASERLLGGAATIAVEIRRRIRGKTGLAASVGVAPNKLLAKIASDLAKPDGLFSIGADNLRKVLDPLPVERLFGIGQKTLPRVHEAGIRSFADLRLAGEAQLWRAFGKHGKTMRDRAGGIDDRPVRADREDKSVSAEETFQTDIREPRVLTAELTRLADRTATRLRAQGLAAGTVTVKIRRSDFKTYTRQRMLGPATQDTATFASAGLQLLDEWLRTQPNAAIRLLGLSASDLQSTTQADLFSAGPPRQSRLDTAVDDIRRRFGSGVLTRASHLQRGST
ncbi:MAG: DNA polymerase IV [Steroidobacteraceae bacterium]